MNGDEHAKTRAANLKRWRGRGENWSNRAPEGRSPDDQLNQEIIEAADCRPGHHVLDIAGGGGEPTISVALHVGGEGRVTAADLAAEMQQGAKRRAANLGLTNIDFHECDMEKLPFANNNFDAVTCRMGIMFAPNRAAAAVEAFRVLKPGARVAYLVWGPEQDNDIHMKMHPTARACFGMPPGTGSQRHVLGAVGTLTALLESAGFTDIEERENKQTRIVALDERFWGATFDRNFGPQYEALDDAGRKVVDDAVWAAYADDRTEDGWQVRSHTRIGIGVKPG